MSKQSDLVNITQGDADINGGAIDGTVIGGSTPAAVTGTTGTFSGNLTVDTNTLFVDAVNNHVGIRTSTPANTLHISAIGGSADNGYVTFDRSNNNTDKKKWVIGSSPGVDTGNLVFSSVNDAHTSTSASFETQYVLTLQRNGNVGIGTVNPAGLFDVRAGDGQGTVNIVSSNNLVNSGNKIAFFAADRADTDEEMAYIKPLLVSNSGGSGNIQLGHLTIGTSGSERMRIDSSGTLIHKLAATFNEDGADADFRVESKDNSNMLFVDGELNVVMMGKNSYLSDVLTAGHLFWENGKTVHTSTSVQCLVLANTQTSGDAWPIEFYYGDSVKGRIRTTTSGTSYLTTSDRRLKENIETITDGTEKLMAMNPVTHTWKNIPDAPAVHGFIAQEMIDIVPEAVSGDPTGEDMMSMDYGRITPVLVAALQDAHKKIAELEARLNELEGK